MSNQYQRDKKEIVKEKMGSSPEGAQVWIDGCYWKGANNRIWRWDDVEWVLSTRKRLGVHRYFK